jgi:hypothetical protein
LLPAGKGATTSSSSSSGALSFSLVNALLIV